MGKERARKREKKREAWGRDNRRTDASGREKEKRIRKFEEETE